MCIYVIVCTHAYPLIKKSKIYFWYKTNPLFLI